MTHTKYLGSASFYRQALSLGLPVMLQVLIQNLVSLIDNFMVAGLGDVKMSGVNITNTLLFVFFVALNTLVSAGGIFMSQFNGAKDERGMQNTFRFKLIAAMGLAGLFIMISTVFPAQILGLLVNVNTQGPEIVVQGKIYLSVITLTFLPIAISVAIGSSLREIGIVRPPLVITVIATLINTFLNWVLIYGNLGAPRLEVAGAGYATLIARMCELIMFIVYIRKTRPAFYIKARTVFMVNLKLFISILKKGGIIFLSEMSWVITETVMIAAYNGRGGAEIVAGMAAAWAIANIFMLVFGGIHTAVGVIVGGTLGRNELELAQEQARWLRTGAIIMGVFVAIIEAFSVFIIPIVFGNLSIDAQRVTRGMLWVISFYMPLWTYLNAQFATARSGGDAIMGAWVDGSVNTIVFLPAILLLTFFTGLGPIEIYAIVKITDFIKVAIAHWQLHTGRWIKNLANEHRQDPVSI